MPVNLSIKNVPEELAERLRQRAAKNHRSLQGELMAIVERAMTEETDATGGVSETPMRYRNETTAGANRKIPLRWPSEAARLVRDSRDLDGSFEETPEGMRRMRRLDASEILARMRKLDIRTPGSATEIIRRMRDERHR